MVGGEMFPIVREVGPLDEFLGCFVCSRLCVADKNQVELFALVHVIL
jgi:hypothetical protein